MSNKLHNRGNFITPQGIITSSPIGVNELSHRVMKYPLRDITLRGCFEGYPPRSPPLKGKDFPNAP